MTKSEANEIKKIINAGEKKYTTYYKSASGEFRVRIASFRPTDTTETINDVVKKEIAKLLNIISNDLRPKYKIDNKKYQGWFNDYFVVFE